MWRLIVVVALSITTATSSFAQSGAAEAWAKELVARLGGVKRPSTPPAGKIATVKVGFRLDRTGKLLSTWLVENSGIPAIDHEALALVERAQPFPAPPAELDEDSLRFTLPVVFQPSPEWEGSSMAGWERPRWLGPPTESSKDGDAVSAKMRSICRGC